MRLIVIGGGAAGFFCAVNAARMNPKMDVIIVEKSNKLLSKVRISGGGRCNVTHACFSIPEMIKNYPRGSNFVKKTFHEFFTEDTIKWFLQRGITLKTEEDGRMFPVTGSSQTIINCLMKEADEFNVQVKVHSEVRRIFRLEKWTLEFADGQKEEADFICLACGGYPKSSMFQWIAETGHGFEEPVPSLFTFNMPGNPITALMGISVRAKLRILTTKIEEEGQVLITHWGLSGPAVLKLSARAARELHKMNYRFAAIVNWSPQYNEQTLKEKIMEFRTGMANQKIVNRNAMGIPNRLWEYLCLISEVDGNMRWADLPAIKQNRLVKNICAHEMNVEGKTTYKEEFVTAGGIRLSEVDHSSMQSKKLPGLYFAGEILDVDGVTGGFNFQHAWTSGWIAAKGVAAASLK